MGSDSAAAPATGASQQWLYPILDGTGRSFRGKDARCPARYPDYRRALLGRRIDRGEGPLEAGFRSMRVGDVLWLYAGHDVGVVGRGTVRTVEGRPEPRITFTLDRVASRVLAQDPVPGSLARRGVPGAVHGPTPLAAHPEVGEGFAWWIEHLDDRDRRRLEPIRVPSLRQFVAGQPGLLDDPGLATLVRTLRSHDLGVGICAEPGQGLFTVGIDGDLLVVGQVLKTGRATQPAPAVLRAVGTLAWCGWALAERAPKLDLQPHSWLVFKSAPSADLLRFLEDGEHSVTWVQGNQVDLGPRTRLRWQSRPRPSTPRVAKG